MINPGAPMMSKDIAAQMTDGLTLQSGGLAVSYTHLTLPTNREG